jgi:transcriptional regulator with XRE-family HTH domain
MVLLPPKFDTLGDRLRWWRIHRGFKKQGDLAVKVGISQGSLSDMEGNNIGPSAETTLRLAEVLGLRPTYLLLGEGSAEGKNFQELNGLEAQLVMIFRQLPNDSLRDALLIDANNMLNRSTEGASAANPFAGRMPPPPTPAKQASKPPLKTILPPAPLHISHKKRG